MCNYTEKCGNFVPDGKCKAVELVIKETNSEGQFVSGSFLLPSVIQEQVEQFDKDQEKLKNGAKGSRRSIVAKEVNLFICHSPYDVKCDHYTVSNPEQEEFK